MDSHQPWAILPRTPALAPMCRTCDKRVLHVRVTSSLDALAGLMGIIPPSGNHFLIYSIFSQHQVFFSQEKTSEICRVVYEVTQ